MVFHQHSASSNISQQITNFLNKRKMNYFTPANLVQKSLDAAPMDLGIWDLLKLSYRNAIFIPCPILKSIPKTNVQTWTVMHEPDWIPDSASVLTVITLMQILKLVHNKLNTFCIDYIRGTNPPSNSHPSTKAKSRLSGC
jgi:hypothetical protein